MGAENSKSAGGISAGASMGAGASTNVGDLSHCGSFGRAFNEAHHTVGNGGTFMYEGRTFTTDTTDGGNYKGRMPSSPTPSSKALGEFEGCGSFGRAFNAAHHLVGNDGTFEYGGKTFTTNTADGGDYEGCMPGSRSGSAQVDTDVYPRLREELTKNEGDKDVVYLDTKGNPTAGVGHLLTPEEKKKYKVGDEVPRWQIEKWLEQDMKMSMDAVRNLQNSPGAANFNNPKATEVLVDMAFQMGPGGLNKFQGMLDAMKRGDWKRAAAEIRFKSPNDRSRGKTGYYNDAPNRAERNAQKLEKI